MGQKATFRSVAPTSALLPKTDIGLGTLSTHAAADEVRPRVLAAKTHALVGFAFGLDLVGTA